MELLSSSSARRASRAPQPPLNRHAGGRRSARSLRWRALAGPRGPRRAAACCRPDPRMPRYGLASPAALNSRKTHVYGPRAALPAGSAQTHPACRQGAPRPPSNLPGSPACQAAQICMHSLRMDPPGGLLHPCNVYYGKGSPRLEHSAGQGGRAVAPIDLTRGLALVEAAHGARVRLAAGRSGPACRGRPCRACAGPWAPARAPQRPGQERGPARRWCAHLQCAPRSVAHTRQHRRPAGARLPGSGPARVGLGTDLLRLLRRRRVGQEVRELFQQVPVRPEQQRDLRRMQQGCRCMVGAAAHVDVYKITSSMQTEF